MVFSGISFLFYFLPCAMLAYFAAPKRLKNTVLLLASLLFYGWGEPKFLLWMLLSIAQGYGFGLLIEKYRGQKRSRVFLTVSVLFSMLLLGFCKYADFLLANWNALTGAELPLLRIALPIGISFYTFQIVSYVIDVSRGNAAALRNPIDLAAYIAMFPQLIAGPIVRYTDIAGQLTERRHTLAEAAAGIRRFVLGLSKKVLIADTMSALVMQFKETSDGSLLYCWIYAAAYMLHIYFDFSGYSDMAIGLGRILGFRFPENFDYPYISASITEFWRRWHMTLGGWFRDYLYIPLGGNRVKKPRWLFNLAVVWMATGLWHGAAWNFVLWGVMFAVLLIIEKLWLLKHLRKLRVLNHIYVLFFVILSFVIFDAESISAAFTRIGAMFGAAGLPAVSREAVYALRSYAVMFVIAIAGATPLPKRLVGRIQQSKGGSAAIAAAEPFVLTALLVLCTAFLVDGSFHPFLYFRF